MSCKATAETINTNLTTYISYIKFDYICRRGKRVNIQTFDKP